MFASKSSLSATNLLICMDAEQSVEPAQCVKDRRKIGK